MHKVLVFKIWGDYAHFKKYYTTTSPLTFEFPPPPTTIGLISAIIGLDKKDNFYLTKFPQNSYRIAIKLNHFVDKVRWSLNLINTKDIKLFRLIKKKGHEPHTQIRTEYLKKPSFTLYFWHNNKGIYKSLKGHLESHTSVYSVYFGLSELLANFQYIGELGIIERKNNDLVKIDSVIPSGYLSNNEINFTEGREIFQVNYPIFMNPERVVEQRENVFFERKARSIECKPSKYWEVENGERIVFF